MYTLGVARTKSCGASLRLQSTDTFEITASCPSRSSISKLYRWLWILHNNKMCDVLHSHRSNGFPVNLGAKVLGIVLIDLVK